MFENILKKYNCEVFVSEVALAETDFDRDIKAVRFIRENGYSIRTLSERKLGCASSNMFLKDDIEKTARESIEAGKYTKPLSQTFSFSDKEGQTKVSGTYDKTMAKDLEKHSSELAALALQSSKEKNIEVTDGHARAISFKYRIMNSLGISKEEVGTFVTVLMDTKAITEKQVTEVPLIFRERLYDKKEYSLWLDKKMSLVSRFIESQKIPSGKYDILLSPQTLGPLLLDTISSWASGSMRLEGTGLFKKIGDAVVQKDFSAIIDGSCPKGLSTFSIDVEGNKTTKRKIVENGIFTNYFYDEKYASYFNETANGCSKRSSMFGAEKIFAGAPYCGAQNLLIKKGKEKFENILEDMKGIYVENVGISSADSETGSFGFELRNAFIVNKGELIPARYAIFSGTVQNLLKKAVLTRETEAVAESGEFSSACVSPYAFLEKQEIAGVVNK